MRIGIIGTGVAGSVLAEMLAGRPGIAVEAFDRMTESDAEEAGTGLNVGPNAMKALRLHLPARHDAVRAASLPWRRWFIDTAAGERLFDIDLLDVAEEPGIRLRWSDLYRVLRAPVAATTRRGLALAALEEDAAGRLVPVLADAAGGLHRFGGFDLLVAGDGRYSRLRELAAEAPLPAFHGVAMSRMLVPDARDCPYDDYGQWFEGRARLLSYRLPGGAVYIAGAVPLSTPDAPIDDEIRSAAFQARRYLPTDGAPCPAVAWMSARLAEHAESLHWARLQSSPLRRVAAGGRVLLLGDAAHAMVPTLGQGATQAIEDGVLAGAVLRAGG
ncbi:FAD-dependent monooxygenase, partial [Neoroseomonas rubea]|uniref:FAD-dependent monooxygenase n=1 Tax=Neoroseomonas rubea TaxID=2748666 RepID=UPI0018DFBAC8